MKFDWTAREKEQFYRKAERQLKEYGIDFIQVDRDQFGVKGWRSEAKTIEAAVITLTPYPYRRLTKAQERALRKIGELAVYRQEGECKGLYRGTDLHALQTDHPKTERKEEER